MATTGTAAEEAWPQSMRAWIYESASAGLDKSLQLREEAPPPPRSLLGADSILVKVMYMSLNPADYKFPEMGLLARALVAPPATPGMDYSGRVVAAGSNVSPETYPVGRLVYGRVEPNKFGTLAEYVVVKESEGVAPAPEGWGEDRMDQLACVGTAGLTVVQSVLVRQPHAAVAVAAEGDRVFINGGSGGTGTFGIQIAKASGLHVTVSCSGANAELCKSLGADEVVDYRTQSVADVLKGKGKVFKLVVDNVGYSPGEHEDLYVAATDFLADDGQFVQVGGGVDAGQVKSILRRSFLPGFLGGGKRKYNMIMTKQSHEGLARIGEWMREGKVKGVIDETFEFEDAPKAYEKLKTGRVRGKIVVKVAK